MPVKDDFFLIRPACGTDLEEVERIMRALRSEAQNAASPVGALWKSEQVASFLNSVESVPDAPIDSTGPALRGGLILENSAGVVESFIFFERRLDAWEIEYLATAVEARRGGRMSRLIRYLLDLCPAQTPVWLEVHERNNSARQMYLKIGFSEVGRRPGYYPDGAAAILYNYG